MTQNCNQDKVPLDEIDFCLQGTQRGNMIHYKGIPFMGSVDNTLRGYSFTYYDPELNKNYEDDPRYYSLIVTDALGDNYYYGRWYSKEKFMKWLKCPYDIYSVHKMGGVVI